MAKHGSTYGVDMLWLPTSHEHCVGLVLRAGLDQDLWVLWNRLTVWAWLSTSACSDQFESCLPSYLRILLASSLNHPLLNSPVMLQEKYLVQTVIADLPAALAGSQVVGIGPASKKCLVDVA